ncbi:biopolymer transporter ExbB [Sphingomonas spermidinifaciens]|uniref:Biopolymer transporter ExbB n=1 Tax=Sphingomonas spermidinifaciens TaxID=1141889 RepID=A0A2A4AZW4_9SPHN|nr:MotA/TolQ/ExbB proton channel family protein [Sphingomonas spermidinifaciens]PCD02483.1 biopolymer transporter ExbB [Sphingomonas spermidinifaciens]
MNPLATFADSVAAAIVLGGVAVASLVRFPPGLMIRAIGALRVLGRRAPRLDAEVEQIAALGRIARKHGAMALDRSVIDDPDIALAVRLIVDGEPPEAVEAAILRARDARIERHLAVAEVWASIAEAAPAFGLIGTIIGLVRMFTAMQDPAVIGPSMAVALLATLYGALLGNLIAQPIAGRLRRLARAEAFERERLAAPLLALARRERPRAGMAA